MAKVVKALAILIGGVLLTATLAAIARYVYLEFEALTSAMLAFWGVIFFALVLAAIATVAATIALVVP